MPMPESSRELAAQLDKEQQHAMELERELETARGMVRDAEAETRRVQSLLDQTRNTFGLHKKAENEVRSKLAELLELPLSSAWVEVTKALAALPRPRKTAFPRARLEELMDGLSAYLDEVENDRGLLRDQHDADVQTIRKQAERIEELLVAFQEREEVEEKENERAAAATELRERTIRELEGTVQELNAVIRQRDEDVRERNKEIDELQKQEEELLDSSDAYQRTIKSLRNDLAVFQAGAAHETARWKSHYAELATAIGVPRIYYGNQQDPQVDAVMAYVARIMPTVDLNLRVQELEARLEELGRSKPATTIPAEPPPSAQVAVMCQCGHLYPLPAAFCPSCSRDNPNVPAQRSVDVGLDGQ